MVNEAQPAAPILSDAPGSFAWGVWNQRHPILIKQLRDVFPFPPETHRALEELLQESISGRVQPLPSDVHDHALWEAWGDGQYGRPWAGAPFLWAESFFYRRLLEAVGYFRPGPWHRVDPFIPSKQAELITPVVEAELAALDGLSDLGLAEQRKAVLAASLWGNRADLGFRITAKASDHGVPEADLVADDSEALWSILDCTSGAVVHLVADNAGRELLADLVLIDHLLATGAASKVVLHLKPQPYYVSDATGSDLVDVLRRLSAAPGDGADIGHRLWAALNDGMMQLRTHEFWCAPLPFHRMPSDLAATLSGATVTILKGDLNYRKLVEDRMWLAATPFEELTGYFPSPVAALRTLKSDVAVGITEKKLAELNASGSSWRTDGTHGLIQIRR
jgi:hypothetical protein